MLEELGKRKTYLTIAKLFEHWQRYQKNHSLFLNRLIDTDMKFFNTFKKVALGVCLAIASTSCTDKFESLNTNPVAAATMDASYLLTYNQLSVSGHTYEMWRGNLLHGMVWGQHLSTPWGTQTYVTSDGWGTAYWDMTYSKLVVNTQEIVRLTQKEAAKNAIIKAWKAYIFHRLTDFWGDVPYSEAGKGIASGILQPKYDKQQDIYTSMLSDLKEAAATLSTAGNSYGAADLIYKGDHAKWKKFANTLRLRLALHLIKVDENLAKQHAVEAINGGLFDSNADNAIMIHTKGDTYAAGTNGSSAPVSDYSFRGGVVLSSAFMRILNERNDPRLPIFALPNAAGKYVGAANGNVDAPRDPDTGSVPNYNTVFAQDANAYFLTYSEAMFLKAEAIQRGWVAGSASNEYEKGVRASLNQFGVKATDVEAYLKNANVVYDASKGLEQIITQKWIGLYTDGFEIFAEVRRSGFPKFLPNEINGVIPRRLKYPLSEQSLNKNSYTEAVSRQGADTETTKVWWDK